MPIYLLAFFKRSFGDLCPFLLGALGKIHRANKEVIFIIIASIEDRSFIG